MADLAREPSMEDILASIKRIIADDGAAAVTPAARLRRGPVEVPPPAPSDEVLELTEPVAPAPSPGPATGPRLVPPVEEPSACTPSDQAAAPDLVSEQAASASRLSLAALSALVVSPPAEPARDNTLEGLVRDMLRPMLKEWLDARLPGMVEGLVAREIARITGRQL